MLGIIPNWQFSGDPEQNPMVNPFVTFPPGWNQSTIQPQWGTPGAQGGLGFAPPVTTPSAGVTAYQRRAWPQQGPFGSPGGVWMTPQMPPRLGSTRSARRLMDAAAAPPVTPPSWISQNSTAVGVGVAVVGGFAVFKILTSILK